jgi:uncharacterized cupin superfamily protein
VFHILEGELTLLGANGERRVGPGATAHLPAGSRHGFRNDTAARVRFLVMLHPGTAGRRDVPPPRPCRPRRA